MELDMLFIHPPANVTGESHTLDADVGYTGQFVAIPMGLLSLADRLDKAGFKVRVLNLGERFYLSKKPLAELVASIMAEYHPKVVGLDIHWMIHSAGAIETARMVKSLSPDTRVVLGGISASYFSQEILSKFPAVDYVMVGECEEAIVSMLREITKAHPALDMVPNLTYRNGKAPIVNPPIVPDISRNIELTRYDLLVDRPVINPDRANISFFRGCINNCDYCAGSKTAFRHIMKREKTGIINADVLVQLMQKNVDKGRAKLYLYGDIRLCGKEYVDGFFSELEKSNLKGAHVVFEFFDQLATEEYVSRWAGWARRTGNTLECTHSPDEGNQNIRKRYGKSYSNEQLLEHCRLVADYDIPQSIYFLLGLPGQTHATVEEMLRVSESVVDIFAQRFKKEHLRHEIVSINFMQIPDAGSNIFRNAEHYGFHLDFDGIEGLVDKLSKAKHWSEGIGYHTDTLSKQDLVRLFYHAQKAILKIYHAHQLISNDECLAGLEKYTQDERRVHYASL